MSCGHCGSKAIVRLSSIDMKLCNNCKEYTEWSLKPNQESILIGGKKGGKRFLQKTHKGV